MSSPTSRTLEQLRSLGYIAQRVEYFNHITRRSTDLWDIIDIIAIHPDHKRVLFVQTTSGSNHASRRAKIRESPHLPTILGAADVEVWSWAKQGARGKRKVWMLRRERIGVE